MKITRTKINGVVNPLGFDFKKIIASWNVEDTSSKKLKKGILEVAGDEKFKNIIFKKASADLDQTGEVIDVKLSPRTRYFWRVTISGDNGDKAVSETSFFETGKMNEAWTGKWIAAKKKDKFHPLFSKQLNLKTKTPVKSARLYVSCLGVFEAYLDGVKIGNEILTPYINDYETGMEVIAFDVTDMLKPDSKLDIQVAKGWYMSNFGLEGGTNFGDRMEAIAELHVEYANGKSEVIGTDSSWKVFESDIKESGIYYGEDLDRTAGLVDKGNAVIARASRKLLDRYSIPVIVKEVLPAKKIIKTPAGETVIDFGQNHAGVMEFDANFPKGTVITIDCGEVLQKGNFYNENYRSARSRFVYTSDGRKETVHPRFAFFGYRYIRIKGWVGKLTLNKIRSNVIYSDMERTGFIETGNSKINRLYQNCVWGQKSNFIDMPTDCPQRDERLGWTGDAQVFSQTASYNMDTRAFYKKFLRDLGFDAKRHEGAVASFLPNTKGNLANVGSIWGDVGTIVPDVVYNTFGSLEDVEEHYEMMKGWIKYMHANDVMHGDKGFFILPFQFGDWLGLDGVTEQSFKGGTNDDYLAAVYYYRSTVITANMAERLGKKADAQKYNKLADKIRKAILDEYFSKTGRLACDTQAAYIVALAFDIYVDREKLIDQFVDRLRKDCFQIKCGFVGAPLLCTTLAKCGRIDLAYHFLFNEGFPSWLYCVNLGATTIWERWNSLLEDGSISGTGMNSLNHYSYGTVVQFMYEYIGGIRPMVAGFKEAVIQPRPFMKFRYFNSSMTTSAGKYVSNWNIAENGLLTVHVEVPFNAKAKVILPDFSKKSLKVSGCKVKDIDSNGEAVLGAGSYEISYMPSNDYRFIYSKATRLAELEGDKEVMKLLKKDLPKAYGIITSHDKENGNLTLGEIAAVFYLGFDPKKANPVVDKICKMNRW